MLNLKSKPPTTLNDAIATIVAGLTPEEVKYIQDNNDSGGIHHGVGTAIRNGWSLWEKDSPLVKDIRARFDVSHGDDCSGLIFTGVWATVRGGDVDRDLKAQAKSYLRHWKKSGVDQHTGEPLEQCN